MHHFMNDLIIIILSTYTFNKTFLPSFAKQERLIEAVVWAAQCTVAERRLSTVAGR